MAWCPFNPVAWDAIARHAHVGFMDVPAFLAQCWKAWHAHRDFFTTPYDDVFGPYAVAVFEHPPGDDGMTESYVFGTMMDVCAPATLKWGKRALGPFKELIPVWPDCPIDPQRQMVWSHSWKGAGGASRARVMLKKLLPKELGSLPGRVRTHGRRRKWEYLAEVLASDYQWSREDFDAIISSPRDLQQWARTPSLTPDEYRYSSKAELFLRFKVTSEELALLSCHIDPMDFYQAASGKVPPDQIEALMKHSQPKLMSTDEYIRPKKRRQKREKPYRQPLPQMQLELL